MEHTFDGVMCENFRKEVLNRVCRTANEISYHRALRGITNGICALTCQVIIIFSSLAQS